MSSMRTPDGANLAITSSPGDSSGNPRTSNPHATLETVAGAKAVTLIMRYRIRPWLERESLILSDSPVQGKL
jgi:hypothetical protein